MTRPAEGSDPTRGRAIEAALAALRAGRPVAFPTETVWGLATPARSESAVKALLRWKGRSDGQPVAVLMSGPGALAAAGIVLSPLGRRLADAFWPGPLTLVVECGQTFAAGIARPDGAVGLRCSSHPVAAALASAAEAAGLGPLTATSLNRSGEPPAKCRAEARSICESHPGPHVLEGWGDDAFAAPPTTVVDLTCTPARILRWGGLDAAAFGPFSDSIETAPAITDRPRSNPTGNCQGDLSA